MNKIITISREYGSGGRNIAKLVAEALEVPYLDKEIIKEAAEITGLNEESVEKVSESASAKEKYFKTGFASSIFMVADQDKVFQAQCDYILKKAEEGPCVIVGRCSDYILEHEGYDVFNVFIYADLEYRIEKAKSEYGVSTDVEKSVKKIDKSREYFYKFYSDKQWGEYENYHMMLDGGCLGEELCAKLIVDAVKAL